MAKQRVPRDPARARVETEVYPAIRDVLVRAFPYFQERLEGRSPEDVLTEQDHEFVKKLIQVVWQSREMFPDYFRGPDGQLVSDRTEPIAPCNKSYEEAVVVQYLLACTRRYIMAQYEEWKARERQRRQEELDNQKKGLLSFFKKDKGPEEPENPEFGKLYNALKPHLKHEWQFDLIPFYAQLPAWLVEMIGNSLLTLHRQEQVEALENIHPKDLEHAKKLTGDLFDEMLAAAPHAIRNLRDVKENEGRRTIADLYRGLGARTWEVVGDMEMLKYAVHLRFKNTADFKAAARYLPDLAPSTLDILRETLSARRMGMFLETAKSVMGPKFNEVFGDPSQKQVVHVFLNKTKEISMNDHYDDEEEEKRDFNNSFSVICRSYLRNPDSFMSIRTMS